MVSVSTTTEETGAVAPEKQEAEDQGAKKFAGKYETAEEMEKGYLELQKMMSQGKSAEETSEDKGSQEDASKDKTEEDKGKTEGDDKSSNDNPLFAEKTDEDRTWEKETYGEALAGVFDAAGIKASEVSKVFHETGEFPEEAYKALEDQGIARGTVDKYLSASAAEAKDLREFAASEVTEIMASVGGQQEYSNMVTWMNENLKADELEAFDATVTSGNPHQARWAVKAMYDRFTGEVGKEADPLEGKNVSSAGGKYESRAQMQADMSDPRYKKDPAFREQVAQKLKNSDIFKKT